MADFVQHGWHQLPLAGDQAGIKVCGYEYLTVGSYYQEKKYGAISCGSTFALAMSLWGAPPVPFR